MTCRAEDGSGVGSAIIAGKKRVYYSFLTFVEHMLMINTPFFSH
jgi:hypothetical protein